MQVHNTQWDTMELVPPTEVQGRPATMRVYLPPREHNASYGMLDCSAVVLASPHYDDPYLAQRISTALAGHYDMHPKDFRVSGIDRNEGDMLVEFPDIDLCRRAVREGFFVLANGTEIQLKQWTPAVGMLLDEMPYRARVRLYDVPTYNRNKQDINHLIAGLGYVDIMAPVYVNGRYDSLRVFMARHNPRNIPQDLLMTIDPYSRLIRVEMEGFINIQTVLTIPRPPEDIRPPPALWRARDLNNEGYRSRQVHRREGGYRRPRRDEYRNDGYRRREDQGRNWMRKVIQDPVVQVNGGCVQRKNYDREETGDSVSVSEQLRGEHTSSQGTV